MKTFLLILCITHLNNENWKNFAPQDPNQKIPYELLLLQFSRSRQG